jgi:hypothetical protein
MGYYDVDKSAVYAPATQAAPEPGYGSVPEYLVSSLPWLTASVVTSGSTQSYEFPKVTRYVQVINYGSASQFVKLGFTANGVAGTNYVKVAGGANVKFDLRVKEAFIRSDDVLSSSISYSLLAGLTTIPIKFAPTLTGSVSSSNGSWVGVG